MNKRKAVIIGSVCLFVLSLFLYFKPLPRLVISDQPILDGQFSIDQINTPKQAWLVLYATKYDQPTEVIGQALIKGGRHRNYGVFVNVPLVTTRVMAVVYENEDFKDENILKRGGLPIKTIFNRQ